MDAPHGFIAESALVRWVLADDLADAARSSRKSAGTSS